MNEITDTGSQSIYLDLDDVLCDTAVAYLGLVDREFGRQIHFENIFSFDLQKSFGLSDEQNSHMFHCAHQPEFILNIGIFEGVRAILQEWRRQGHRIHIVTGRHTASYRATLDWLEQHAICYDSFTMVDKYGWQDTDHDLAVPLAEIRDRSYSFGIEDNIEMTRFLSQEMGIPVLLHDRPWNRDLQVSSGANGEVKRFESWKNLRSMVDLVK